MRWGGCKINLCGMDNTENRWVLLCWGVGGMLGGS